MGGRFVNNPKELKFDNVLTSTWVHALTCLLVNVGIIFAGVSIHSTSRLASVSVKSVLHDPVNWPFTPNEKD